MIRWLIAVPGLLASSTLVWALLMGGEMRTMLAAGLVLCVVLFMAVVYRPTRWYAAGITLALPLALIFLLQPVCVPIDPLVAESLNPPLESRTDRDVYMDVFRKDDNGNWLQCKTWLSRQFFF